MRAFLPLPPNIPFCVFREGRFWVRYWTGPHYPANTSEIDAWRSYLEANATGSDQISALQSILEAEAEAKAYREANERD